MNIKHIRIPFDEIELFKNQEKYQSYLIETLIYSTKANIHSNDRKTKCLLIITKSNLWTEEEGSKKKKNSIPLKAIIQVVKSQEHPELVLLTEETYDNLRISTTNDQRCQNIISSLAFYFTYLTLQKKTIRVFTIRQNSLLYFERTVKEKKTGPKFNLQRYPSNDISYIESNDTPDIFGKIVIQKLLLYKQIYVEGSHLIHIAKVNETQNYICHSIDISKQIKKELSKHKNIEGVQKLVYARCLEYKIQLFFEYLPLLKQRTIKLTSLFQQLYKMYDLARLVDKEAYITPKMLLKVNQDSNKLVLRQFRYHFLLFEQDYNRYIYQKIHKETQSKHYFINKMFNIGLLLYENLFGRVLFEHQDLQFISYLKENMKIIPFPKHMNLSYSKKTKMFIQNCILGLFQKQQDILLHPWVVINKINI